MVEPKKKHKASGGTYAAGSRVGKHTYAARKAAEAAKLPLEGAHLLFFH